MDGNLLLSKLRRLSQIETLKDVKPLAQTTYPGTHCPLFGAAMTLRQIRDAVMLVIGTEECTYYTKSTSLVYDEFGGLNGRCLSLVMDQHDVTFGFQKKMEAAAKEIVEEYQPPAVFLVTTCVPEITGEDIDSVGNLLTDQYGIPFLTVHTEHFRCDSHLPGIQNVLEACTFLMEPQVPDGSVNLLGQKAQASELAELLQESGIRINLTLPSLCSVEEIRQTPRSAINIVCGKSALPLAKRMEKKFGIPWISFYDRCEPEAIAESYERLYQRLALPLPVKIEGWKRELMETMRQVRPLLEGGSFLHGHSAVDTFVLNDFLSSMGMEPLMIQTKEIEDEDQAYIRRILGRGHNPYVTRSANLAALQSIYGILKPNLYLGPAERKVLLQHGIIGIGLPKASAYLGFQLSTHILAVFAEGMKKSKEWKETAV